MDVLQQEMREDLRNLRREQQETREATKDLAQRVDGNTLILNMVAGVASDHEARLDKLESR